MHDRSHFRSAAAWLAAAALAGCTTPHVQPQVSQAVLDARAHRDAPPGPSCEQTPLDAVSPATLGFAFDESALTEEIGRNLAPPARWLVCHPAAEAVIKPAADVHGTAAEQAALARARAETVRGYLVAHGVSPARIRVLAINAAEPAGSHVLIRAEGRRW